MHKVGFVVFRGLCSRASYTAPSDRCIRPSKPSRFMAASTAGNSLRSESAHKRNSSPRGAAFHSQFRLLGLRRGRTAPSAEEIPASRLRHLRLAVLAMARLEHHVSHVFRR
jgi:hypothetical protein